MEESLEESPIKRVCESSPREYYSPEGSPVKRISRPPSTGLGLMPVAIEGYEDPEPDSPKGHDRNSQMEYLASFMKFFDERMEFDHEVFND